MNQRLWKWTVGLLAMGVVPLGMGCESGPANTPGGDRRPGDFVETGARRDPGEPGWPVRTLRAESEEEPEPSREASGSEGRTEAETSSPSESPAPSPSRSAAGRASDAPAVPPTQAEPAGKTSSKGGPRLPDPRSTPADSESESGSKGEADSTGPAYPVAGMVGRIHGRAIYSQDVFAPIEDQLTRIGNRLPPAAFRERAQQLIEKRLGRIVTDAMMLGRAQRNLTQEQTQGLKVMVQQKRKALIRRYGRGSATVADQTLQEKEGTTLSQKLEDYRRKMVVRSYMRKELYPRIDISRRDIERYYHDHADQYQKPARRRLRLIRVNSRKQAEQIQSRLDKGEPFAQVAESEANLYSPDDGGLMPEAVGSGALAHASLNEAASKLAEGEAVGPVKGGQTWWFLYARKVIPAQSTSLREAQLEIKRKLKEQEFDRLMQRYRRRLFQGDLYRSLARMGNALLDIAVSRYAAGRG